MRRRRNCPGDVRDVYRSAPRIPRADTGPPARMRRPPREARTPSSVLAGSPSVIELTRQRPAREKSHAGGKAQAQGIPRSRRLSVRGAPRNPRTGAPIRAAAIGGWPARACKAPMPRDGSRPARRPARAGAGRRGAGPGPGYPSLSAPVVPPGRGRTAGTGAGGLVPGQRGDGTGRAPGRRCAGMGAWRPPRACATRQPSLGIPGPRPWRAELRDGRANAERARPRQRAGPAEARARQRLPARRLLVPACARPGYAMRSQIRAPSVPRGD